MSQSQRGRRRSAACFSMSAPWGRFVLQDLLGPAGSGQLGPRISCSIHAQLCRCCCLLSLSLSISLRLASLSLSLSVPLFNGMHVYAHVLICVHTHMFVKACAPYVYKRRRCLGQGIVACAAPGTAQLHFGLRVQCSQVTEEQSVRKRNGAGPGNDSIA